MTEWIKAPKEVIDMANGLIDQYHEPLKAARIGFLMRDFAPVSKGKRTMGKAMKVDPKWKPLMQEELDFVIWLATDVWLELSPQKKRALIDHELQHCAYDKYEEVTSIRPHDVEEFTCIIQRHGLWNDDLEWMARAAQDFQPSLFPKPERSGSVVALDPAEWIGVPA